ncbi:Lipopolysaccharide-induced tumor necrosis factor-alpha factor [Orchesella cincta]|uniref:Lipopolysaccharide-induced tumor necrosis factor-alpha factor n=1 Tax=Orchesella cincta TaxID=48709 RepID=A0A1D2MMX6_ORCCI|nr:Lipopolysaccharide-induced tumor necrosis factor-alpha factor [Orchesella cincta]
MMLKIMAQPQVVLVTAPALGPENVRITCSNCHREIQTSIEKKPSVVAFISAAVMFLFGCWLCCCIPFCMDSCMDVNHKCPSCGVHLGTHKAY